MTKAQIQIEITRNNMQLAYVREQLARQKRIVEEDEHKLSKLKQSLDNVLNKYEKIDKINESFDNASELRFVKTWLNYRKEQNSSVKKNAIIPTKNVTEAGYDIYACSDEDITIKKGEEEVF